MMAVIVLPYYNLVSLLIANISKEHIAMDFQMQTFKKRSNIFIFFALGFFLVILMIGFFAG